MIFTFTNISTNSSRCGVVEVQKENEKVRLVLQAAKGKGIGQYMCRGVNPPIFLPQHKEILLYINVSYVYFVDI